MIGVIDARTLAAELAGAYDAGQLVAPPASRGAGFDLSTAYLVERELVRMRRASGRSTVGVKVGYANKAMWRALHLDTLVWAHMYDDTVRYADGNEATLSLAPRSPGTPWRRSSTFAPKIEPEIVFKLKAPIGDGVTEAAAALEAVEWLALGFEIIDCPYPDWKYQPADFVAAFGLHAALIVGTPRPVRAEDIPELAAQLPTFKVRLEKDGQLVEQGSGRNSLRSPALCLAELASAMARRNAAEAFRETGQDGAEPLAAGDLVSSGTLTESTPIQPGATWTAAVEGLDLPVLTLHV